MPRPVQTVMPLCIPVVRREGLEEAVVRRSLHLQHMQWCEEGGVPLWVQDCPEATDASLQGDLAIAAEETELDKVILRAMGVRAGNQTRSTPQRALASGVCVCLCACARLRTRASGAADATCTPHSTTPTHPPTRYTHHTSLDSQHAVTSPGSVQGGEGWAGYGRGSEAGP